MDVPLKHVIGTIALIGLVIAVSLSYSIITSSMEADILKQQLKQISEYVALNLVEVISLINFANFINNQPMMKILDLPSDLGGRAYTIKLIKIDGANQIQEYYVQSQLTTRNDIYARSSIPIDATQNQIIIMVNGTGTLQVRGEEAKIIECSSVVYGGTQEIRDESGRLVEQRFVVVWGLKVNYTLTYAGIGVWRLGGS